MAEESKPIATADKGKAPADNEIPDTTPLVESDNEDEQDDTVATTTTGGTATKKKKSKRKRVKAAITGGSSEASNPRDDISKAVSGMGAAQMQEILKMNPSLAQQLGVGEGSDLSDKKIQEAMKKLDLESIMTGLASSGKNVKDMASYKFWQTQPVPKFDSKEPIEEGPFKIIDVEKVPKEPGALLPGFEWVTMDLTRDEEIQELFSLLYGHYVEDDEAMFRFNYSESFLKWYVQVSRRYCVC